MRIAAVPHAPPSACLSYAEETVWQLNRLRDGSDEDGLFGRMSTAFRLTGPLDVAALQRAAIEVVRRHAVLRTSFVESAHGVTRYVHPLEDFQPVVMDVALTGLAEDRDAAVARIIADEASRPFELRSGPLWRCLIIRMSDVDHVLQLTVHHIVSDAWSGAIILRDLGSFYNRLSGGLDAELPELPARYADYAAWERDSLTPPRRAALVAYWRTRLQDAPRHLDLPADCPREPRPRQVSATLSFVLSAETGRAVAIAASRERATPFMFLLTVFKVLLHKLSGQNSVVVGAPMVSRNRVEWEHIVGLFLDMLSLRTDIRGEQTFIEVLGEVRRTVFGAVAHSDMPPALLAQAIGRSEDAAAGPPLFSVIFNFRNSGLVRAGRRRSPFSGAFQRDPRLLEMLRRAGALKLRSLRVERLQTAARETSQFDVTLNVNPSTVGEIRFDLIYNSSLFSLERMRRFSEQYAALVHHALADPRQPIGEYPLTPLART